MIGLVPDVNEIINSETGVPNKTRWHNWLQQVRSVINRGQITTGSKTIPAEAGLVLPASIRSALFRIKGEVNGNNPISANPQISPGFDSQEVTLEGTDASKKVTLQNGNGLQLQGGNQCVLGDGDVIKLHYNEDKNVWIENYRSINS